MTTATLAPPPTQPPTNVAVPPARLPKTTGPTPYRWTIAEYRELYKTGLFHDKKTMLLDGVLYVMVMPGPLHDTAMTRAFRCLSSICPDDHYVRNQQGFNVGNRNDPGPDLAVVSGVPEDHITQTPTTAVLIVEVADSSLFIDTTTKAELYATAGVPDYWVLDLEHRQLLVFRDPVALPEGLGATAYRTHFSLNPTDSISPLRLPNATIRVADLFPRSPEAIQ